ncbi:MAG: hypothetical protein JXR97_08820 [Planctomycetes bacterium]|nr:hypothetical protein [Planctomycetota bacterium]
MPGTMAVILADPNLDAHEDLQAVAGALNAATGMIAYDGVRLAKKANGILIEGLEYKAASDIVAELDKKGISAGVADSSSLGTPELFKVKDITVNESGITYRHGYTGSESVGWESVAMINVCLFLKPIKVQVVKEKPRKGGLLKFGMVAAGGPIGAIAHAIKSGRERRSTTHKVTRKVGEGECYIADIHCFAPNRILRVQSDGCGFGYLGDRLVYHGEHNFQNMVSDISSRESVLTAPPAMRFLDGDALEDTATENIVDFERYNRWLFLATSAFAGKESK